MAPTSLSRRVFRLFASSVFLALVCQLAVAGPAHAAAPAVAASPNTGPPTQSVTVSGTGFAAGQPVSVHFDTLPAGEATSNATGSFTATFTVPAAALPGAHSFTAVDATGLSASTPFTVQTPWTGLGFDAARTGFNGLENMLTREHAPGLGLAVSVPIGSISSTPAFSGGRLYFGTDAGVFRVAGGTGPTWTFNTGGPIHSSPAIYGNPCQSIVFGSDDGKLYRLGCDGTLKWSFASGGPVRSSPLILNNVSTSGGPKTVVYFGSGGGSLYALDLITGGVLWSAAFGGAVDGSPSFTSEAAGGGIVVAGSADGTVRAFGAGSGSPMWSTPVGGPVAGGVPLATAGSGMPCQAFASYGAAAGALTGGLASLNCLTGAPLWSHPMDTVPAASPGLLPDSGGGAGSSFKVIVGGANGNVYALERGTGIQVWGSPAGGGSILSGPTMTDGVIYMSTARPAGGTHGDLKIMDGDGNLIGSLPLSGGSPTQAPSAIVNNGLVIAPSSGGLDAFTLQSLWPQFHNDTAKLGYNPYEATLTLSNLGSKWTFSSGSIMFSPVATNGNVYVGSSNGNVYALNATTGAFKWIYTTGDWVVAAPAVSGNSLYVGSKDGTFYALNAATGALLWTFATSGPISAPATVKNGVVYVGSEDQTMYALSAANGALIWSYTTGGKIFGAPAVVNNVVYFGSLDHNVYALSAANGSLIWNHTTGDGVASSPAVTGGVVYVGSYDNYMYALSAANGGTVWQFQTGGWIFASPAVAYGKVFFGSTDQNIYALDLNGNQVWAVHTDGDVISSPAVANGVVAVGSYDGNLYVASVTNGIGCSSGGFWSQPYCWGGKIPTGGHVYGSPAIAYGKIYAGSYGGKVIAIGP